MGRRFAEIGGIRRNVRGPAVRRGGGGTPQTPPLPASAVEYWHSELGVALAGVGGTEVDSWTGQLRGVVCVSAGGASQRPGYGVDGANFNGRPVVQCASSPKRYLASAVLGTPLTLVGTKPYAYMISRFRDASSGTVLAFSDTLPSVSGFVCVIELRSGKYCSWWFPHAQVDSTVAISTNVVRLETFIDAAGSVVNRVDGVGTAGAATGLTAPVTARAAQIGGDRLSGSLGSGNANHAFVLLCSAEITAPELAALNAWALAYWGV